MNNNNNIKHHNSNEAHFTAPVDQSHLVHQQQHVNTNNQKPNINSSSIDKLTDEAKLFAQSRYPFSPFILRFSTPHIHEQKITDELYKFLKDNKKLELELSGVRKASTKCSSNKCDLLLFVKTSHSFSILCDEKNWPQSILGLSYTRSSTPTIPPQLSLIIKNVSLSIDFVNFTNEIKESYPNVRNIIRMKTKNQTNSKLVKLEFSDHTQRDEILNRGKIFVNSLTYDVDEYLAPARVLICSKCMGIGHFRKQCKQEQVTCKRCGINFDDINNHTTTCTQLHCKHCQGDHMSNDMKCPKVKQFRADLIKFLLSPAIHANPQYNNSDFTCTNFPPMNPAQRPSIYNKDINRNNSNNYDQYEGVNRTPLYNPYHWSSNTSTSSSIINKIDDLIKNENNIKLITAQHEIKITRHENLFMKLIFPILDEISSFLLHLNSGKHGGTLDADFKVIINRMRAQLNNAKKVKTSNGTFSQGNSFFFLYG
jgi:hypothetical protein